MFFCFFFSKKGTKSDDAFVPVYVHMLFVLTSRKTLAMF